MKKIISLLLVIIMCSLCSFALVSCSDDESAEKIRIGYMAGPTGMGMAKLIHDNGGEAGNSKYEFKKYTDTNLAKADLAAGRIDVICLPTNEAAQYYNQGISNIQVLAINCLNSLYLLSDKNTTISSLSDLNGKTIYTCQNGTPRIILELVLELNDIDATVSYEYDGKTILTPADIQTHVIAGELPIAVMPEPLVTASLLQINKNGNTDISYSIDLNLADAWESGGKTTPITMGCIVGSTKFINANTSLINSFLDEYEASVSFISNKNNRDLAAEYIVECGVLGAKPAALKALTNLDSSIAYIDGADMKTALVNFYKAIQIKVPDSDFYYN